MIHPCDVGNLPLMWTYYPELLETPVPRYTSFPTAAEFTDAVGRGDLEQRLGRVGGDVSLYVHIPFCQSICWYCGCNTGAANRRERLAGYLEALHQEIALVARMLDGRATVRRVALGGGSPNAISPTDFVRLVDTLSVHFGIHGADWSVEIDPRSLTRDWQAVFAHVPVTRASFGVQTFAAHLQAAIGRVQPDALIENGTRLLRDGGVTSLNFDLMYGLPGQTRADLESTLARSVELGADRIALFGYAHVPHLIPRQKRIDARHLPGQRERFAMAALGHDWLVDAGYQPVGFDHFARPGDPLAQAATAGTLRRNFQGFTDDAAPVLIGLGASAISMFPELIVQNEKNAGRYRMLLSQGELTGAVGVHRTASDRARGALIEDLLCRGRAQIDVPLSAATIAGLEPFVARRLIELSERRLTILPGGLPYARTIAALFDPYRQDSLRRFSSAV